MVFKKIKKILRNLSARIIVGLSLATMLLILALFAPVFATHDPYEANVRIRLTRPGNGHLLGTDEYGRDVYSRIVYGSRVSIYVGFGVVLISTTLGSLIGLFAGYYRKLDGVLMRIMDALMSFPSILFAIAILAAIGPKVSNVIIALAVVYTPRTARVIRGQVLSIREETYVESARVVGLGSIRIIFRYILPNVMAVLIVQATFILALTIIAEAGLSYIGAGTPAPTPSWGNILADGRPHMHSAPWMTIFPGLFIMVSVLGLNIVGDGLRDVLDPRLRGSE